MTAYALAEVQILQAGDAFYGLETRYAESEAVHAVCEAEDHVVLGIHVEDGAGDDAAEGAPVGGVGGGRRADDDDAVDEAKGLTVREGLETGVDGGGAERVSDEGDGPLALDFVDEGVGEELAGLFGAVARAAEGVVDVGGSREDLDRPEGGPECREHGALDDFDLERFPGERGNEVLQGGAKAEERLHFVSQGEDFRGWI